MPTKVEKYIYRLVFYVESNPIEEWFSSRKHAVAKSFQLKADYVGRNTSHTIHSRVVQISAKGLCEAINGVIADHCLNEH